jgi:O-antigen/teichoic acid export membrane protein
MPATQDDGTVSAVTARAQPNLHRRDARHAAVSGAVQALTVVAQGLLGGTQVVFARLYGQEVYGWYLSALAVMDVVCRAAVAGADKAMLRYVPAFRARGNAEGVRSALATALRLALIGGALLGSAVAVAGPWLARVLHEPALAGPLRILAPLPLLMGGIWILMQSTLAARVVRANFYVRGLAEPALLLVLGVAAGLLGCGIRGLAAAQVLASAATLTIAALVARRVFGRSELTRLWAAPGLRGFAPFSLPIAAAEVLNLLAQRGDMVVIAALLGPRTAALYGAAEMAARPIVSVRGAFDSVLAGVLSETLHGGELPRLDYNLRLTTRWVVSVAAPAAVTLVVLRREVLVLLFGPAYAAGAGVLAVLAASQLVSASLGLNGWVLLAGGHSRLGLLNNVVAAVFNLATAVLLVGRFGIIGAAYATLATMVVLQAIMMVQAHLLHRTHPLSAGLWKPLAAAAVSGVAETLSRWYLPFGAAWARIGLVGACGALVYVLLLLALGLPDEERRVLSRLRRRASTTVV